MKFFILLCMIFCHIVDNYYFQGWLASAKQRSWWQENAPDKKYRHDYIVALLTHSFSWAFMIMVPCVVYRITRGVELDYYVYRDYLINMALHAYVDNAKANWKSINLIEDQAIHIIQIVATWIATVAII